MTTFPLRRGGEDEKRVVGAVVSLVVPDRCLQFGSDNFCPHKAPHTHSYRSRRRDSYGHFYARGKGCSHQYAAHGNPSDKYTGSPSADAHAKAYLHAYADTYGDVHSSTDTHSSADADADASACRADAPTANTNGTANLNPNPHRDLNLDPNSRAGGTRR